MSKKADRGAKIIQLATELMRAGKSKGWSDALAKARAEIRCTNESGREESTPPRPLPAQNNAV